MPNGRSPCGRFTRGFVATPISPEGSTSFPRHSNFENAQSKKDKANLFWLKDSWRPNCDEPEITIYYELKAKSVTNLPEIIHTGDICIKSLLKALSMTLYSETVLSRGKGYTK